MSEAGRSANKEIITHLSLSLSRQDLESENQAAQARLERAREQAEVWQGRVSKVLKQSASYHLNSN